MNYYWSENDIQYLINNYKFTEMSCLCKALNRTKNAIAFKARQLDIQKDKEFRQKLAGIKNRKYEVDQSYFKKIDTHEKAYWLGFLWADGHVKDGRVVLSLNYKDINHIKTFLLHIKSKHPIKFIRQDNTNRVVITSREIYNDLIKHNIIERKTYIHVVPNINLEYLFSFLLGLYDGDGTYDVRSIRICTNTLMANWIKNKLFEYGIECKINKIYKKQNVNISINKEQSRFLFLKNCYSSINFNLKRKIPKWYLVQSLEFFK